MRVSEGEIEPRYLGSCQRKLAGRRSALGQGARGSYRRAQFENVVLVGPENRNRNTDTVYAKLKELHWQLLLLIYSHDDLI